MLENDRKRNTTLIVNRGVGIDVPEPELQYSIKTLEVFNNYFNIDNITSPDSLKQSVLENSQSIREIIRSTGTIHVETGTGWITYTPMIMMNGFNASLYLDLHCIQASMPIRGQRNSVTKECVEIRFPIDNEDNKFQWNYFNKDGVRKHSIDLNIQQNLNDVRTYAFAYHQLTLSVVMYAKNR